MSDDYRPSKIYWHEALDRSHVACDHFYEYVQQHPAIQNDAELEEAATQVTDAMQDFYQLVGKKYHEFEQLTAARDNGKCKSTPTQNI